ncbi:hypothetical protein DC74_2142 [Streptomyces noursei]|nr:hypothetical protein DC74_2142 [Streptomyces noursei]
MRHRGPQTDGRDAGVGARLLEDADDARGALVAGLLQVQPAGHVGVGGDAADRYRPGVRGVAQQGAQHHHHLDAQLVGEAEEFVAERAPAHARLDAADQDEVAGVALAVRVPDPDDREPRRGPGDLADAVLQEHRRAVHLEVVVVLRVERGEDLALPLPVQVGDRGGGGIAGVVPALERGHHDRVDQLGHPLQLDHPAPPSGRLDRPGRPPALVPLRALPRLRLPGYRSAAPLRARVRIGPRCCVTECGAIGQPPWRSWRIRVRGMDAVFGAGLYIGGPGKVRCSPATCA